MYEELRRKMNEIYDKHTKRDDGRCLGCHSADGDYVPEVYNHVLERDFIDEICEEQDEM